MAMAKSYKELDVYRNAIEAAMEIYQVTKGYPADERFSMVDQMRRSSRSVCANIAEAWRRRRYKAAFINKLNESESEAAETQVWIEFALRCGYMEQEISSRLDDKYDHVISQLVLMIGDADRWTIK